MIFVKVKYCAVAVCMLLLSAAVAVGETGRDTKQTIDYLIDFVAASDCTFLRNGKTYSAKEAAAHVRSKYDYFKGQIHTPEDFIRLAATKSELSGTPYLVKLRDGQLLKSGDWLEQVLADYRAAANARQLQSPEG